MSARRLLAPVLVTTAFAALAAAAPAQAATCNYQGGAGGDWRTAANWSCGVIPDGDDDVVLDNTDNVSISTQNEAAASLTSAAGTTLTVANRTLDVAGPWNTTGGNVSSGGTVRAGGAFSKTGPGRLDLRGATVILDAASSISGGAICVGVASDGNGFMELNETFSVLAGADATPFPNCGNIGRIRINGPNGRFLKDSPGSSTVGQGFDNDDTVQIAQGELVVANGQASEQQAGTWVVPSLRTLRFTAGFNSITGSVNSAGTVAVQGGTVSLAHGAAFQSASTEITGGTLEALGTGTATTDQLLLNTGARSGSRTFTTGSFDARGGSLRDGGNTVTTGTFTKTTAAALELRGGTLTLNGTSSISGGHICVGVFQDGNGFMEIGGTFSILPGAAATPFPNCGNIGRIRVNAPNGRVLKNSPGVSTVGQGFDNDDTVEIAQGELDVANGHSEQQSGAWIVPTGTVLHFSGGTNTLTGAGSISGAGTLRSVGGTLSLADGGAYSVTATEIVGGTLTLDGTTGTATTGSLLLNGGTRGGSRTLTAGSMDARGGRLQAAGPTVVTGTFTKTTSAALDLRGATLTLNGASSIGGGHLCVGVASDGHGILLVGGTLTLAEASAASPIQNCGNTSTVTIQAPDGRLQLAGSTAKTVSSTVGNAGGTVAVGGGQTLALTAPYSQTAGATTVAPTGTLQAAPSAGGGTVTANGTIAGSVSLTTDAVLRGGGTVTGNVANTDGVVQPGGSPGHLSVGGSYTQGPSATIDVEIEGTGQGTTYDWLDVAGAAVLDGTVNVLRPTGFDPANTDVFQFLTSASRTGAFDSPPLFAPVPGGKSFVLDHPAGAPFGARLLMGLPPAPTAGQPTISGTPASGQTLTCNTGSGWTNVSDFAFQWLRDGQAIGGATQQTYGVTDGDRGHALSCRVTGSNASGSAEGTSAAVDVPPPPQEPPGEEPPVEEPPAEEPPVTQPPPATIATPPAPPAPPAPAATPQEERLAAAAPSAVAQALGLRARACLSRRRFTIRLREPAGVRIAGARITVGGKRVAARRRNGRMTAVVDLRGLRKGRYVVRIVARTVSGRTLTGTRRYRTCATRRRAGRVRPL